MTVSAPVAENTSSAFSRDGVTFSVCPSPEENEAIDAPSSATLHAPPSATESVTARSLPAP